MDLPEPPSQSWVRPAVVWEPLYSAAWLEDQFTSDLGFSVQETFWAVPCRTWMDC